MINNTHHKRALKRHEKQKKKKKRSKTEEPQTLPIGEQCHFHFLVAGVSEASTAPTKKKEICRNFSLFRNKIKIQWKNCENSKDLGNSHDANLFVMDITAKWEKPK